MTYKGYTLKSIRPSHLSGKKKMATFQHEDGHIKVIHFGSENMSDYTKHKDPERKRRYIARHSSNENWNNPLSAGSLSKNILWNKSSYTESVADFRRRFNL